MSGQSWFPGIQGLVAFLTGNSQTTQRRNAMKVIGTPVFDDGVQTVLGGVQTIVGSGTWDGQSSVIQVKGSGARVLTLPQPAAALTYEGLQILITDFAGNSGSGTIAITPTAGGLINGGTPLNLSVNSTFAYLIWRAANNWQRV